MLSFHFLNVQHGDCVVIEHQKDGHRYFGVVDSNTQPDNMPAALRKLQELGAEELSFVCLTHPHGDHFKGMHDLLQFYHTRIQHFYTFPAGGLFNNRDQLRKYVAQLRRLIQIQDDREVTRRSMELLQIILYAERNFGPRGAWFEAEGPHNDIFPPGFADVDIKMVMPPPKAKGGLYVSQITNEDLNNPESLDANGVSLALKISYKGKTVLLGGDATVENWLYSQRTYNARWDVKSDVVKLPHHGSKKDCTSDTLKLFFKDTPETAGIISANGNSHPDSEVLDWLLSNKVKPYCTNLSKKWNKSDVVDLVNTTGLESNLQRFVRQSTPEQSKRVQPCKGDIHLTVNDAGLVNIQTQYNNICGCHLEAVDNLFTNAA